MAEAADETTIRRRISVEDIIEKLDRIPAFTIADADGNVRMLSAGEGEEPYMMWLTDAALSKKTLEAASKSVAGASLACMPLGRVTAIAAGWATMAGKNPKFRIGSTDLTLATYAQAKGVAPEDLDGWVVPVFFSKHLVRKDNTFPIFLDPEHVVAAWKEMTTAKKAAGEEPPPELQMQTAHLLELVKQMHETDLNDWGSFVFIGSKASLELAASLQADEAGPPSTPANIEQKKAIVAQLNRIPCFTLANGKREVFMRVDPETREPFIPWMLDGAHATATLKGLHSQA